MREVLRAGVLTALSTLLTAGVLATAPPASATPTLYPGNRIVIPNADGSTSECTAGFAVTTSDPTPGFLTAGHCTQEANVNVYADTAEMRVPVGWSRITELHNPNTVGGVDVSLVDASRRPVNIASTMSDGTVITGVSGGADLDGHTVLCKIGYVTGTTCGLVTKVTDTTVQFGAEAREGDSGGPVYAVWPDGSSTAVAVLSGAVTDEPGTAVAKLIAPWLRAWALKLR